MACCLVADSAYSADIPVRHAAAADTAGSVAVGLGAGEAQRLWGCAESKRENQDTHAQDFLVVLCPEFNLLIVHVLDEVRINLELRP